MFNFFKKNIKIEHNIIKILKDKDDVHSQLDKILLEHRKMPLYVSEALLEHKVLSLTRYYDLLEENYKYTNTIMGFNSYFNSREFVNKHISLNLNTKFQNPFKPKTYKYSIGSQIVEFTTSDKIPNFKMCNKIRDFILEKIDEEYHYLHISCTDICYTEIKYYTFKIKNLTVRR